MPLRAGRSPRQCRTAPRNGTGRARYAHAEDTSGRYGKGPGLMAGTS